MNTNELEQQLRGTGAYSNPRARAAIDTALSAMRTAEEAGNGDKVNRLKRELTLELGRILAESVPAGLSPEALELLRGFEVQFGERMDELDSFGIIDRSNPKIKGIDDKEYPAPSWEQIKAGFTPEKMALISQLENPTLLLVPDGMSLKEYIETAGSDKPEGSNKKKLPWNKTADIDLDSDKTGALVSDCSQYDLTNHGGKTKMERLREPGAHGWQVYVVDGGDEVPANTLNKKADDLLKDFRAEGFGGLTAEAVFALQMHGQALGKPFDRTNWGWLLESYLMAIGGRGVVLNSDWFGSHVRLNRTGPVGSGGALGARRSVRVL